MHCLLLTTCTTLIIIVIHYARASDLSDKHIPMNCLSQPKPPFLALFKAKYHTLIQGTHGTGETGKMAKKIPVRENTGNLEMLPKLRENTGNFVCSSCKFPDSKGKGYCDI